MVEQFLHVGLFEYLLLSTFIFVIGIAGVFLNRRNIIILLMCIELMLLSANINFVAFSYYLGDIAGQIFSLFILTVAAAEIAIGLAIAVLYFRNRGNISIEETNRMRG